MNLNLYTTAQVLDSLPEELWYSKNSGLWSIRTEEDEILFYQSANESFEHFIRRFARALMKGEISVSETYVDSFLLNIAMEEQRRIQSRLNLNPESKIDWTKVVKGSNNCIL